MKLTRITIKQIIKEELQNVLQEQQDSITKGDMEKALWTFSKAANEPVLKIFNAVLKGLTAALESRDAFADVGEQKTEQFRSSILKIVEYLKNIITETLEIIQDGAQEGEVSDLVGVVTNALKGLPFNEIKEILTYKPIMNIIGVKTVTMFIETFIPWGKAVTTFGKMASFVYGALKDTKDIVNSVSKKEAFNTFADEIMNSSFIGLKKKSIYEFKDRSSDERQYCSPGVELPVCSFSRSKAGSKTYPEYHTSLDNFSVVTKKGLEGSFEILKNIIDTFELTVFPKAKNKCEPFLTKRNLYPTLSIKSNINNELKNLLDILAYSNGKRSVFQISNILNLKLKSCLEILKKIKKNNLIF